MPKHIKRFAVEMTEENLKDIIEWSNRKQFVTADFEVTFTLNAEEGMKTYFVIEKHSDELSLRYYQMDSEEFDSKFKFYNGNVRHLSTITTLQEIKPV